MGPGPLRRVDADLLLAVLDAARQDDPGPVVPWALLDGLQRLVPCDWDVSCQEHDHGTAHSLLLQMVAAGGARELHRSGTGGAEDASRQLWWTSACHRPERDGDRVLMSMPAPPGEARRFLFLRSAAGPFDARDRQVLELLRPHLLEVWLDADRRRAGVPALSPREREVLALAAAGLSTTEIAAALWISVGTVRKHMEHVREKHGVHTIAAAAARALPHVPGAPASPRDGDRPR
jgi:DNA-binding CsgD family transcriptional regulator